VAGTLPPPSWRDGRRPGPRQPCPAGCHAHTTQLLTWAAGGAKVANKTGKLQDSPWSPPQGVAGSASVRCAPGSQSRSIPDLVCHGLCLSTALQGRAVQAPEGFGGEDQRAWAPASMSGTSQTLDRALRGHTEATGPAPLRPVLPAGLPALGMELDKWIEQVGRRRDRAGGLPPWAGLGGGDATPSHPPPPPAHPPAAGAASTLCCS
jgi:hypothetical protein